MSKVKRKQPKFIKANDPRLSGNVHKNQEPDPEPEQDLNEILPASMFFEYNSALRPPYKVIIDTNMLWQTCVDRVDLFDGISRCLLAKIIPVVTSCIVGELEKLGRKYHLALKLVKDPRFKVIKCGCRGNYADDCIVNLVSRSKVYLVATNDKDLKRRIRKIPGVPILYLHQFKFHVERLPEANYGTKF